MLWVPSPLPHRPFDWTGFGTLADISGFTLTSGAAHTKGSWVQLYASTPRTFYGVWIDVRSVSGTGAATPGLIDIGLGANPNEFAVIPNYDAGYKNGLAWQYFPLIIPAGSRISARWQSVTASDTCVVRVVLDPGAQYPHGYARCTQYGANLAASAGTSVTAGTPPAFGSWTNIGSTTSRDHRAFTVGFDALADTTTTGRENWVEIGTGSGDIIGRWCYRDITTEEIFGPFPDRPIAKAVPAGAQLQARTAMSGGAEARGIIIYAFD